VDKGWTPLSRDSFVLRSPEKSLFWTQEAGGKHIFGRARGVDNPFSAVLAPHPPCAEWIHRLFGGVFAQTFTFFTGCPTPTRSPPPMGLGVCFKDLLKYFTQPSQSAGDVTYDVLSVSYICTITTTISPVVPGREIGVRVRFRRFRFAFCFFFASSRARFHVHALLGLLIFASFLFFILVVLLSLLLLLRV
jgi:hypothetical protein